MKAGKIDRFWVLLVVLLVVVIVGSGALIGVRYGGRQVIEISLSPDPEIEGEIYILGAVNNPGCYSLAEGDGLADVIQAAGGTTENADLSRLELSIPEIGEESGPQKIDINRAEAWLLQALPGIGEVRAEAIIDYRNENNDFHNINELTKVPGIGTGTYHQISEFITVAD